MATEARKFRVGIFVIGAVSILVVGLIWLGASRFFENTLRLVTYYSESVQGLDPGAAVKYRGVPSGRVEAIRVAPDGDLIEVVLSMDVDIAQSVKEDETLRAQLQLTGLTGLRYIEINRHSGEALNRYPALNFKPPHPVIRSTPSTFIALQDALEDLYKKFSSIDTAGISGDIRNTLQAADALLRDEHMQEIVSNFSETSNAAVRVSRNLERITKDLDVEIAMQKLSAASDEADAFFAELRTGATGNQLRQALQQTDRLALSAQQFVINLQQTMERLDRTVSNLEQVMEEVRLQPSRLLFSEPPPVRQPGDGRAE